MRARPAVNMQMPARRLVADEAESRAGWRGFTVSLVMAIANVAPSIKQFAQAEKVRAFTAKQAAAAKK